ncbi:hypothetical protein ACVWZB_004724 [Paenibacillus polymyxa]
MKVTLLKIELPTLSNWGILQINNFSNTFYRFSVQDGKPVLDPSFFAEQQEDPELKHQHMDKNSDLYKAIQQLLEDYYLKNVADGADVLKKTATVVEMKLILNNLMEYADLMDRSLKNYEIERFEKLKKDFDHLVGQLGNVEKRVY